MVAGMSGGRDRTRPRAGPCASRESVLILSSETCCMYLFRGHWLTRSCLSRVLVSCLTALRYPKMVHLTPQRRGVSGLRLGLLAVQSRTSRQIPLSIVGCQRQLMKGDPPGAQARGTDDHRRHLCGAASAGSALKDIDLWTG